MKKSYVIFAYTPCGRRIIYFYFYGRTVRKTMYSAHPVRDIEQKQ